MMKLLHRLIFPPFGDDFHIVFSFYNTRSGQQTCRNCHIKRAKLAGLLRQVRRFYGDFCAHTLEGSRRFTLKEVIALYCRINMRLRPLWKICQVIQAWVDTPDDIKSICENCDLKRRTYFYYINKFIKKPYLMFCRERSNHRLHR